MGGWNFERLRCEGFEKKYFKDICNVDTQEEVESTCVAMMGFEEETNS